MSIYQSMPLEEFDGSVASRFARDYESMGTVDTNDVPDARKGRQLDNQSIERQGRLYVDPETLISETGQDAGLTVNEYGTTLVGTDVSDRPLDAVETDEDAIAADLVPDEGQHIVGYTAPVEEPTEPVDPENPEVP